MNLNVVQSTNVRALVNYNLPAAPPGATAKYPPGTYRLKFEGRGTVKLGGDARYAAGDSCAANLTLSNTLANTYVSCTFTVVDPSRRYQHHVVVRLELALGGLPDRLHRR